MTRTLEQLLSIPDNHYVHDCIKRIVVQEAPNLDHFELWAQDLETTTCGQITGHLADPAGMCCLGRLSEVSGLGHWDKGSVGRWYYVVGDDLTTGVGGTEPEEVDAWLGMNPERYDPDRRESIGVFYNLNDTLRFTFPEIALVIREGIRQWREAHQAEGGADS